MGGISGKLRDSPLFQQILHFVGGVWPLLTTFCEAYSNTAGILTGFAKSFDGGPNTRLFKERSAPPHWGALPLEG